MPSTKQFQEFLPALFASGITALTGIFLGVFGGFTIWADDPTVSIMASMRGGIVVWLASHGSGITVDSVPLTFLPLGMPLVIIGVFCLAIKRFKPEPSWKSAAVISTSYVGVVTIFAFGFDTNQPWRAMIGAIVISAVSLAIIFRSTWWEASPEIFHSPIRGIAISLAVVAVAGATVTVTSLLVHRETFAQMWSANAPNALGAVLLTLLTIAMVPNISLWAVSVMIGPGFALGAQTGVDLGGSQLVAVPSVPIFAAVPPAGGFGAGVFVLALIPVVAGGVAGWFAAHNVSGPWRNALGFGALAGAVAGLVLSMALAISGGSIGPELMSTTGPDPWEAGRFAVIILAVGGAGGGLLAYYRGSRADNE